MAVKLSHVGVVSPDTGQITARDVEHLIGHVDALDVYFSRTFPLARARPPARRLGGRRSSVGFEALDDRQLRPV